MIPAAPVEEVEFPTLGEDTPFRAFRVYRYLLCRAFGLYRGLHSPHERRHLHDKKTTAEGGLLTYLIRMVMYTEQPMTRIFYSKEHL
ncbi:hypothetical protein Holit_03335 [Hollandina sp. SP2]